MAVRFMIEVSKLSKSFGKQIVLSDISFQIPDGQIIGLSGKSGIGKTTLSRILCGTLPPDRGNIFRNGIALWEKQSYKRSQGLAIKMVNQHPFASLDP